MFDLVLSETGQKRKISDFRGNWFFLAGKCPRCGKRVAKATAEVEDIENVPDVRLPSLNCCRLFPPVEMALVSDGQIVTVDPIGMVVDRNVKECASSFFSWNQVILWSAWKNFPPEKQKPPAPPEVPDPVGLWLKEMASAISDRKKFIQRGILFSEKEAEKINKRQLYADLWKLPFALYRWAESLPDHQANALFALYRTMFRAVCGNESILVGVDENRPLFAPFKVPEDVGEEYEESPGVAEHIWPFDMYAFSFGFPGDVKGFSDVFVLDVVTSGESLEETLEKIRSGRRYTLTPGGVRALLPKGEIVQELTMEENDSLVFAVAVTEGEISFPVWLDWREGFGFSPWQMINGFRPREDPLLGLLARTFCDLVTAKPAEIKKRVLSEERAKVVLLPSEGEAKLRKTVYVGRGRSGTSAVRQGIPTERKAPAPHAVAGHLRRVKKHASPEAVERARYYGIQVPDGYTFIRPFRKGMRE